jgi:glycosyltransferase involved in cell wall biosynthesis
VRVVQLAAFPGSHRTSFISMLAAISQAVAARGWSTEVFLPSEASDRTWVRDLVEAGAVVEFAPSDFRTSGRWLREMLESTDEPTVLHTHFTGFDVPAFRAANGRRQMKVIWHMHTVLEPGPRMIFRNLLKLGIGGRAVSAILCPSEDIAHSLIRRGAPRRKVHPVPTPIDPAAFPPVDAAARREAREALGLPEDDVILLHFGWHWRIKGGDLFLETVRELRRRGVAVFGLSRSGVDAQAHVRKAGMQDDVHIQQPVEKAYKLYAAADVLVASSRGEGMPFSLLEALCTETPVVATDIPGHRYVGHLAACRIREPTPQSLADGVEETLARSPEQVAAEAKEGRDWVSDRLSLERFSEQVLHYYDEALGIRAGAS